MKAAESAGVAVEAVAQELACERLVEAPQLVGGGRNSRIHRISTRDGKFALKQYFAHRGDSRDRLGIEAGALGLMERRGIDAVPRIVALDRSRGFVLMTWIDGLPVNSPAERDIDLAADFLAAVHGLSAASEAELFPEASEACLSGSEIERQIRDRLRRLNERCPLEPDLDTFVRELFAPAFGERLAQAVVRLRAAGIEFDEELPASWRSLIPADFGFHNCLRRPDGSLAFLDFEYFGWDDPVKLTADFLLHPGMALAGTMRKRFRERTQRCHAADPRFSNRLAALITLFGLRWVLILLNEFLPERWQQRLHAGMSGSWEEAKQRQLDRARSLLMDLTTIDREMGQ